MLTDGVEAIRFVAEQLGPLRDRMVFLGGTTVGLLISEPGSAPQRPTKDVDVIVQVASSIDYLVRLRNELVSRGFRQSSEDNVTCRYAAGEVKVDIMPTDASILGGFKNKWYPAVWSEAKRYDLPNGPSILLVSPACFLATKLDAFADRGQRDFAASHDLDDIVAVIDGRNTIVSDIESASGEVRAYLAREFGRLLSDSGFLEALPGQMHSDNASQARLPTVLNRMKRISDVSYR